MSGEEMGLAVWVVIAIVAYLAWIGSAIAKDDERESLDDEDKH
jgi:hypothetical protein